MNRKVLFVKLSETLGFGSSQRAEQMSQWAQRPATDRFWDIRDASNQNYIVYIFIYTRSVLRASRVILGPTNELSRVVSEWWMETKFRENEVHCCRGRLLGWVLYNRIILSLSSKNLPIRMCRKNQPFLGFVPIETFVILV